MHEAPNQTEPEVERLARLVEAHRDEYLRVYAERFGDDDRAAQRSLIDFEREMAGD